MTTIDFINVFTSFYDAFWIALFLVIFLQTRKNKKFSYVGTIDFLVILTGLVSMIVGVLVGNVYGINVNRLGQGLVFTWAFFFHVQKFKKSANGKV